MYIVFTEFTYDGVEPMVHVELFDDLKVAEQYYNNEKILCKMALDSRCTSVYTEEGTSYIAYEKDNYMNNHVHIKLEKKEVF